MLRKFFHVLALDYRSYGDSSEGYLAETYIIEDTISIYKWLRRRAKAEVFIRGHALGASIGAYTISKLCKEKSVPTGLFLEAGFTKMRDKTVLQYKIFKFFSWLPWFNATILDPLEFNGFRFPTQDDILNVNCPIMIVHDEDDLVVPYSMGEKIFKIAKEMRNQSMQGVAIFHLLPAHFGYDHWRIYQASELTNYIE